MPNPCPSEGSRRISIWSAVAIALIVGIAMAAAVAILRQQAAKSHRTEVLLTLVQGHSHRLSALEWQVAGERSVRARTATQIQGVRDETLRAFSELGDIGPGEERLEQVLNAYREYDKVVSEELRLISEKKYDMAEDLKRSRVDPAFGQFSDVLSDVVAAYSTKAKEKDRSAFVLSAFALLAGTLIIGLLFWRVQNAHRRAELILAEREALQWSEQRFRSLIQNASDAILLLDTDANVNYASMSLQRILGYRPAELTGRSVLTIVCPDDVSGMREYLDRCLDNKEIRPPTEFCFRHAEGGRRTVEVIGNNRLDDPSVQKIVINCRDVTERKEAEEQLRNSREQLRSLSAYLQTLREKERAIIAREIHDELGQALTALKMDVSWLGNRYRDYETIAEKSRSMAALIDSIIQTVKRISSELRPGVLDDLGLTAAIEWQSREFRMRTGIECKVSFDPENIVVDKALSTAIFRIFQETLTNVIRHAEATTVTVSLEETDGEIILSVEDNGKGITEEQMTDSQSFGLIGMRERASFLGGSAIMEGSPGKGTIVRVRLPLDTGQSA